MKKLKLNDLRVQSFVTTVNDDRCRKILGASGEPCGTHYCTPNRLSLVGDCGLTREGICVITENTCA